MSGVRSKRSQLPPSDDIKKKKKLKETLKTHDEKELATKNHRAANSIKVGAAFNITWLKTSLSSVEVNPSSG